MFTRTTTSTDGTDTSQALGRRLRRHIMVGIAVAATVMSVPFSARAEPRPIHDRSDTQLITRADSTSTAVRPGAAPLLDTCPVNGSATFEDSWGWARSGGRSHEGVDLIAARGVPVVAVRDGEANFTSSNLGGRAVWLTADNGDKFYYAHLDSWEGDSRVVAAGDVIGYVGSSGNARGTHLHFETMPQGSVENPYPHTLRACVPPPSPSPETPIINEVAQMNASAAIDRVTPAVPADRR